MKIDQCNIYLKHQARVFTMRLINSITFFYFLRTYDFECINIDVIEMSFCFT